jgi:hypothetical protein
MLGVRSAQPVAASGLATLRESALPRKRPSATPMQQVVMGQQQTCALMPSSIGWPRFAVFECSVTLGKHDLIGERLRDAKADADVAMICRYGAPMRGPQQVRVIHK